MEIKISDRVKNIGLALFVIVLALLSVSTGFLFYSSRMYFFALYQLFFAVVGLILAIILLISPVQTLTLQKAKRWSLFYFLGMMLPFFYFMFFLFLNLI